MKACLSQPSGILQQSVLKSYERYRKPAVAEIQKIQAMQARLVSVKNPLLLTLRRLIAPVVRQTPLFRNMRDKIAMGVQEVNVSTSFFQS